jgi:ketosteroid isomerase-like protein
MWDAYDDEGIVGILAFAAPDAHWQPYSAGGRVFETTAEYREYIEEMGERDEVVEASLSDVQASGEHVLVKGRLRLRAPSGLQDTNLHWVHRVRDGQIVFTASFVTREEALAAAGLQPPA